MCFITDPTFSFFCSVLKIRRIFLRFHQSLQSCFPVAGMVSRCSSYKNPPLSFAIYSRVSRIHQLLSPNPTSCLIHPLQHSTEALPPIRHICGLGASVGCERIKRTFNTPRLKSQICLIGGNGFVYSLSNELKQ